jgi:hypothetical protein
VPPVSTQPSGQVSSTPLAIHRCALYGDDSCVLTEPSVPLFGLSVAEVAGQVRSAALLELVKR